MFLSKESDQHKPQQLTLVVSPGDRIGPRRHECKLKRADVVCVVVDLSDEPRIRREGHEDKKILVVLRVRRGLRGEK